MLELYKPLEEALRRICRKGRVYYIPNPGNWGDGLIRYGTLKFFKSIGLEVTELTTRRKDWMLPLLKGGTVIYGGGGAWCDIHNHSERIVKMLNRRFRVAVLPSTYGRTYTIPDVTFFARDIFESAEYMPNATFCHDMAFFIGDEFTTGNAGEGEGFFFRKDIESAGKKEIPESNIDISMQGNHLSDVSGFFKNIDKVRVVHTDRLHVSVAAALLNKEVHLYSGAYFKNRAIYNSSLKSHFKQIYFHEL